MHIPASVDGYSDCFHHLVLINSVATNICGYVFVRVPVFNSLAYIVRRGISGYLFLFSGLLDCQILEGGGFLITNLPLEPKVSICPGLPGTVGSPKTWENCGTAMKP